MGLAMSNYVLEFAPVGEEVEYEFRGGAREFIRDKSPEVVIAGPAETGKTVAACMKLHLCASKYPGAQIVIARKFQADTYGSVLQTYEKIIEGSPVEIYGGHRPQKYIYPNGSVIWVAGLDKPGKALSSERDIIYINQAEEVNLNSWETLTTRTTGRGAVMPYTQTIGDANPGGQLHWIRERSKEGSLVMIKSVHQDNPSLYDREGNLTKQGERTMLTLRRLTGVRRKRLLEGIWATAEGAVYDMFDATGAHVCSRDYSEMVDWYMTLDEGYTNPAVILLVGEDSDGRWHIFKEFYETGKLQDSVVDEVYQWDEMIREYQAENEQDVWGCSIITVDAAAAGLVAALRDRGVGAKPSKGRVLDGINKVQNRLAIQEDGRPRLTVDPRCIHTINEFESYVWKTDKDKNPKDEPKKENDHAMDAIRYLSEALDQAGGWLIS
jgi:phage terminase large subunit